jgi:hypothetical protein
MAITKALRGADIKVFINGRLYPWVVSARWSASYGRHAISGIDQSTPFELVSGACTVKGTFDILRIRASGGLQGAGIAAPERKILQEKYFSVTIVDRMTDTVILQIDQASVSDENWQTAAKSMLSGSFSFEGLAWVNEVDI